MYKKFEENNDVSLLVFGHEESETGINIIPLYVPKVRCENTIRLFFLKEGENSHYCVIRMSRLISSQVSKNRHTKYVCDYCLNYFGSQEALDKHMESCSKHKAVNTRLPESGENILKFKNIQNCVECPIKIYADTESILRNIDETHDKDEAASTARDVRLLLLRCFSRGRVFYGSRYVRDERRTRRGG